VVAGVVGGRWAADGEAAASGGAKAEALEFHDGLTGVADKDDLGG
jgi:hypothetical protein